MHFLLIATLALLSSHGVQTETPELVGRGMCLACHEGELPFQRSPHGEAECEDCHGPGSLHAEAEDDTLSFAVHSTNWRNQQCLSCHKQSTTHVGDFLKSAHGKNQLDCTQCHDLHPEKSNFGLLSKKNELDLCVDCHRAAQAAFRKPYHHPVLEGGMECSDCHNPHSDRERSFSRLEEVASNGCMSCHADKKGPFVFSHAPLLMNGCESCHSAHGSFNPKLLIRNEVHQLCLECHSMTPDFATSQPPAFHDIRSPRYRSCTTCHREIHGSNVSPSFLR